MHLSHVPCTITAAVFLVVLQTSAQADGPCEGAHAVGAEASMTNPGAAVISGQCAAAQHSPSAPTGSQRNASSDGEVEPEPVWALEPVWGVHPETGEVCLDLVESGEVTVNDPIGLSWESRMLTMLHDARLEGVEHRWCDGSSSLLVADPSPQVHRFVRTIELPAPELWVAPGYALTGMPAFLQIEQQEPFEVDGTIVGFGGLEVVLAPQAFEVDWGDGTVEVIDDGRTGAAWDGPVAEQISHTYVDTDEGSVVRVEAGWQAVWRVGGFSGVVDDLQVVGELDLPVQTRRAVRVAPDHTP